MTAQQRQIDDLESLILRISNDLKKGNLSEEVIKEINQVAADKIEKNIQELPL